MYQESDFPAIQSMEGISLEELSSLSLMNRIDTKYITTHSVIKKILANAYSNGYRVCEVHNKRLQPYYSVYYDTHMLNMYTDHRNKKLTRQKVRVRTYLTSNQTFLEIKNKTNKGRTKKKRIPVKYSTNESIFQTADYCDFLTKHSTYSPNQLHPEATTQFSRFTLVNAEYSERITIDINLQFHNFRTQKNIHMEDLVIIELKQDGRKPSKMRNILLEHRVFPYKISKYCLAVTLTEPTVRKGRFLQKIRHIEKLTNKHYINNI